MHKNPWRQAFHFVNCSAPNEARPHTVGSPAGTMGITEKYERNLHFSVIPIELVRELASRGSSLFTLHNGVAAWHYTRRLAFTAIMPCTLHIMCLCVGFLNNQLASQLGYCIP